MLEVVKRLTLAFALLLLAASVLLYADRGSRNPSNTRFSAGDPDAPAIRVAVVLHASLPALEEALNGVLEELAGRGFVDGGRVRIRRFNAEADIGAANTIAKEVTGGSYDLIISLSTTSLQTVANANKSGRRTPHVFGLVSDPFGAGVGIDAANPAVHPPYLTGYGSMQPVEDSFRTARAMRPELQSVGLVWNPAEANSRAQTLIARTVCKELGIQLVEANAENSTAVLEAANSLVARGVEALWISGDVTISLASDLIIDAGKRARIPVFTVMPPSIERGALFDLGANYLEVGRAVGRLAADVLDGGNPADIPVENFVPKLFLYNDTVLAGLKDRWTVPDELRQQADGWITATSRNLPKPQAPAAPAARAQPGRRYRIGLAYFAPEAAGDICMRGILDALRDLGFEEGRNLEVRRAHAQAEIANIPALLQNFDSSDVDLIVPLSTPLITGACALVKRKPVVFTYCSDPIAAGAGRSFTDHLTNVTGIGSFPPVEEMVDLIRKTLPGAKKVGTIYNASEANSVKVVGVAREVFAKAGLELDEVTVASSAEVVQAAQALASRQADAFYIQGDNTVIQGFDAVIKAARDARIPLFADDPESAKRGAAACLGLGFYRPGYAAGQMAARVLTGTSPANIPIVNISEKSLWFDLAMARELGITFPAEYLAQGETVD